MRNSVYDLSTEKIWSIDEDKKQKANSVCGCSLTKLTDSVECLLLLWEGEREGKSVWSFQIGFLIVSVNLIMPVTTAMQ